MVRKKYDVVIVGAGISGAVVAKSLAKQGKRCLILEAGLESKPEDYKKYLERFYTQTQKVPNSPYPPNPDAPSGSVLETAIGTKDAKKNYYIQMGPKPFGSDFVRIGGGTTLHWNGMCPRMLPNDFKTYSEYGRGKDWPIDYHEMQPWYQRAEREMGVSGNTESINEAYRKAFDIAQFYEKGYVYPMHEIPSSYSDKLMWKSLEGTSGKYGGREYPLMFLNTPVARNSYPNPKYQYGEYTPQGAAGYPYTGMRCQGNSNCVPICPIQAKYNALKTLESIKMDPDCQNLVDIQYKSVASQVHIDRDTGRVSGITYKRYFDEEKADHVVETATGTIFVLAAHAIQNAILLQASGIGKPSQGVGCNLMDNPTLITWGYLKEKVGSFRGPTETAGISTFQDGPFRKDFAAFRLAFSNWGWQWAKLSPYSDFQEMQAEKIFGKNLREKINGSITKQISLYYLFEQTPTMSNRVTIDQKYRDQLGNFKPVLHYDIEDYVRKGFAEAYKMNSQFMHVLNADDQTSYPALGADQKDFLVDYEGGTYQYWGAGHVAGTHAMGFTAKDSVLNRDQRSWDHENLYMVGSGNFPTMPTGEPTVTITALSFWAADTINNVLDKE